MLFTLDDVRKHFAPRLLQLGQEDVEKGRVTQVALTADVIKSSVSGEGEKQYHQDILVYKSRKGVNFDGICDCPIVHNCRHVSAALIAAIEKMTPFSEGGVAEGGKNKLALSTGVSNWLHRVENAIETARELAEGDEKSRLAVEASSYRLLFILSPDRSGKQIILTACKGRMRQNGAVAMASPVSDLNGLLVHGPDYIKSTDVYLLRLFIAMRSGFPSSLASAAEPRGKVGDQLLRVLLEEKRLCWANSYGDMAKGLVFPLSLSSKREAELAWHEQDGVLKLHWKFNTTESTANFVDYILATTPPWYIDNLSCGELVISEKLSIIPLRELQELVDQAPILSAHEKLDVSHFLLSEGLTEIVPAPQKLQTRQRTDIQGTPVLSIGSIPQQLHNSERWHDYAQLFFDYDGIRVNMAQVTPLIRKVNGGVEYIIRDESREQAAYKQLESLFFAPVARANSPLKAFLGALELPSQAAWVRFVESDLAALTEQGWAIIKEESYRYDLTPIADWYAEISDKTPDIHKDWFDLELGIVVNDERISLLPILVDLIHKTPDAFDLSVIEAIDDQDQLLVVLPTGQSVALPWGRLKAILTALTELYFSPQIKQDGSLRMSKLEAARLAGLDEETFDHWHGGEEIRAVGRKLASFGGVRTVTPPLGLQATLRDYQLDGLSWMQFLREYGFSGILADDMGLGKTIQTLAHILMEKESGRLDLPVLIVAPTSLMTNWQEESAKFAPELRVLVLQGKERALRFSEMADHDLVLTSYALLPRDEETLLDYEFHMIILDESQYIKNMHSKAAQVAGMLQARHRLCLTGTPLENHLGELWSQFHFLQPSLLGGEKRFNTEFRFPIEKTKDDVRLHFLRQRVKPFLLRRTKDKVAKELPLKTEVVKNIELTSVQRDMYETLRLSMNSKVRKEIAKKGVARSQMIILEALMKLRQVCCDPRLVKSDDKPFEAHDSAKLADLMQMLQELIEEKRAILVFSQFTSMLALIEKELAALNIPYSILTGATIDRAAAIRSFQSGEVPVFLISLKAGGVGLNLTAADTVIHYDPWWNPATESQATDRAWRIGQDKPVFVYKMIANGTLEQKIQVLQKKKADLAKAMLSTGDGATVQITPEDLDMIFAPLYEE